MTTPNEKGSRDTGSDLPSGGSADRPSGTYEGDESVPQHGEPGLTNHFKVDAVRAFDMLKCVS
jgi:hypothetical protein